MFSPHLRDCVAGLACYLIVCVLGVLSGRGVLRVLRWRLEPWVECALAPLVSFTLCVLAVGLAGALLPGVPLRQVVPWLLASVFLAAGWGAWRAGPLLRGAWLPLGLCLLLPMLTMGRAFKFGLCEYPHALDCDGHAYVAGALYRWELPHDPKDVSGTLPPYLQFARTTREHARYVSCSLLALLSPLVEAGDTLAVAALLQSWALFVLGGSALLFGLAERLPRAQVLAVAAFSVLGGWIANTVWANNFDQLLALACAPGLAGLLALEGRRRPVKWLLVGAVVAATLYIYPEGSMLVLLPAFLAALPGWWQERAEWRWQLGGGLAALALAALLVAPNLRLLVPWVRDMVSHAAQAPGARPGENWFPGLLEPRLLASALWGLSGESYGKPYRSGMNAVGLALTVLFLAGCLAACRERRWGLVLAVVFPLGLAGHFLLHLHYGYGAYKALAFGWWCVVSLTVGGFAWLVRILPSTRLRAVTSALAVTAALGVGFLATRTPLPLWPSHSDANLVRLSSTRQLPAELAAHVPSGRVLVCVDDWLASYLAVYRLRDVPIHLGSLRGFLEYAVTCDGVRGSEMAPLRSCDAILTDDDPRVALSLKPQADLIWERGPYRLWRPRVSGTGACVCHVENNSRGYQTDPEGSSFWLGHNDTEVYLYASRAGVVTLTGCYLPDLKLPQVSPREIAVRTDAGVAVRFAVQPPTRNTEFSVPVHEGMNRLVLRVEDPHLPSNFEPPWLILRLIALRAALAEGPAPLRVAAN